VFLLETICARKAIQEGIKIWGTPNVTRHTAQARARECITETPGVLNGIPYHSPFNTSPTSASPLPLPFAARRYLL
jgi:hypothetical protein